jgi:hypothetical protein
MKTVEPFDATELTKLAAFGFQPVAAPVVASSAAIWRARQKLQDMRLKSS